MHDSEYERSLWSFAALSHSSATAIRDAYGCTHAKARRAFLSGLGDRLWGSLSRRDLSDFGPFMARNDMIVSARCMDAGPESSNVCDVYINTANGWTWETVTFDSFREKYLYRKWSEATPDGILDRMLASHNVVQRPPKLRSPDTYAQVQDDIRRTLEYPKWWGWCDSLDPGGADVALVRKTLAKEAGHNLRRWLMPAAMVSSRRNACDDGYLVHVITATESFPVYFREVEDSPSCFTKWFACEADDLAAPRLGVLVGKVLCQKGLKLVNAPTQTGPMSVLDSLCATSATRILANTVERERGVSQTWRGFLDSLGDKLWCVPSSRELGNTRLDSNEAIVKLPQARDYNREMVVVRTGNGAFCIERRDGLYYKTGIQGGDSQGHADVRSLLGTLRLKPCPSEFRPISVTELMADMHACFQSRWWGWRSVRSKRDGGPPNDENLRMPACDQKAVMRTLDRALSPKTPGPAIMLSNRRDCKSVEAYIAHVVTHQDVDVIHLLDFHFQYKTLRALRLSELLARMERDLGLTLLTMQPASLFDAVVGDYRLRGYDPSSLKDHFCMEIE